MQSGTSFAIYRLANKGVGTMHSSPQHLHTSTKKRPWHRCSLLWGLLSLSSGSIAPAQAQEASQATAMVAPPAASADATPGSSSQRVAAVALAQIMAHNDHFVRQHDARYFAPFSSAQHPRVTVVACADSRFHMADISGNPDGDVFVVRNIGNQIDSSQGSVEYAMRHLRTPLLLILGHVGCGAIHAAMSDYSGESPALRRELDGLLLALRRSPATGNTEARWRQHILSNIHQQVRYAVAEYRGEIDRGQVVVVGAIYDFRGELGAGHGRMHILNINGDSEPSRLHQNPIWREVQRAMPSGVALPTTLR